MDLLPNPDALNVRPLQQLLRLLLRNGDVHDRGFDQPARPTTGMHLKEDI